MAEFDHMSSENAFINNASKGGKFQSILIFKIGNISRKQKFHHKWLV